MDDETLRRHLEETVSRINTLPEQERAPLLALVEQTRQRHAQLRDNCSRIAQVIDDWRVTVKYLLFDREASQRELAELRRRLDEQQP